MVTTINRIKTRKRCNHMLPYSEHENIKKSRPFDHFKPYKTCLNLLNKRKSNRCFRCQWLQFCHHLGTQILFTCWFSVRTFIIPNKKVIYDKTIIWLSKKMSDTNISVYISRWTCLYTWLYIYLIDLAIMLIRVVSF